METPIEVEIPWRRQRTPDVIKLVPSIFSPVPDAEVFLDKYYKRTYAKAIVTMCDDDNIVGSCKCSNCRNQIDLFSKFCSNCGAKLTGRIIFDKDYNETD